MKYIKSQLGNFFLIMLFTGFDSDDLDSHLCCTSVIDFVSNPAF